MALHPIRRYREQHDLTQQQTADLLGVSRGLISLIESKERSVTPENASSWEGKLGIDRAVLCPAVFRRRPLGARAA